MDPQAAAIYCRISDDREGRGLGVERQRQDCSELAARLEWPVAETYVDNDISAYSGKPRPQYERMCRDITERSIDAVIYYRQDRLARQALEFEQFIALCRAVGLTHLASVADTLDLANPEHLAIARVKGAFAEVESANISMRIRRKHQELAQRGEVAGGGTRPYGFKDDRKSIDRREARIIREAAKRILAGDSLRSVCVDFNRRGIPTSAGGEWTQHTLRRILMSGRISGQREYKGELYPAVWGAIIPREQSARLRALLGDERRAIARSPRSYLLGRILRCSHCGAALVGRRRGDGKRRYVCAKGPGLAGCNKTVILADDTEALVVEAVLLRLDTPELAVAIRNEAESDTEAAAIQADLDAENARLDELTDAYGRHELTMREWLRAGASIRDQIDKLKRALSRITHTAPVSDYLGNIESLRDDWATLDLSRQRAIVATILDSVRVGPAVRGRNVFDPSRLSFTWNL